MEKRTSGSTFIEMLVWIGGIQNGCADETKVGVAGACHVVAAVEQLDGNATSRTVLAAIGLEVLLEPLVSLLVVGAPLLKGFAGLVGMPRRATLDTHGELAHVAIDLGDRVDVVHLDDTLTIGLGTGPKVASLDGSAESMPDERQIGIVVEHVGEIRLGDGTLAVADEAFDGEALVRDLCVGPLHDALSAGNVLAFCNHKLVADVAERFQFVEAHRGADGA